MVIWVGINIVKIGMVVHSSKKRKHFKIMENITIQHARSTKGRKGCHKSRNQIIKYKLDGYFEYEEQKFACEYYGCNWPGCSACFQRDREIFVNDNKSLAQR